MLTRTFDGFGSQKQFALEQTTGVWAFSIDADERVTPDLAEEVAQAASVLFVDCALDIAVNDFLVRVRNFNVQELEFVVK